MRHIRRLQARDAEITARLAELSATEEPLSDVERGEVQTLTAELADVSVKLQAALSAENDRQADLERQAAAEPAGESLDREHREVIDRASLANYLLAASRGESLHRGSAEAEAVDAERGNGRLAR